MRYLFVSTDMSVNSTENSTNENGSDEPTVLFSELGLDARVLASVVDLGYEKPSPIQAATIRCCLRAAMSWAWPRPVPERPPRSRCPRFRAWPRSLT